jgi:Plavaka transposase
MQLIHILQLPDDFKDFFAQHSEGGKGPDAATVTYLNRELFHAQWKIIMDDEFLLAYSHGVVIKCADGLQRRFYLRLFTYSADYPEK